MKVMMDEEKYGPPSTYAPWLIITHENDEELLEEQTFCTMSPSNQSYVKTIPELHGKSIIGSCLGWLILQNRHNTKMYSVWNPVTLQSICLPELVDSPDDEQPTSVVITSDSTDSIDSRPVLFLFFVNLVFFCRPTSGDDCKWIKQSLDYDGSSVRIAKAITLNGEIFAYTQKLETGGSTSSFARMKFTNDGSNTLLFEPKLTEAPYSILDFQVYPFGLDHLVEVDGVIYAVHINIRQWDCMRNAEIYKAFVSKLDLIRMKWIPVKSLGDRAFLLGDSCCTWCYPCTSHSNSSGILIKSNCIYFSAFSTSTVHSYCLQDDSYSFILPHSSFLGSFNGPTWFMKNRTHTRFAPIQVEQIERAEKVKYSKDRNGVMDTKLSSNNSLLSQLPDDMIISIAKRLHLFDYMNFRNICKTFQSKIPQPEWRDGCSRPLFMSLKNTKGICELRDPYHTTSHIIRTPLYPDLSTIEFSSNGWLLFRSEGICLEYFNPFTQETGDYPFSYMMLSNASYGFSTCPNSPGCLTVGIQGWGTEVSIDIFQHGNKKWDNHVFNDIEFRASHTSSPKYYNGAFYFISCEGNIGVLKIIDGGWNWKVYRGPLTVSLTSSYLVEVNGELICVFIQQLGKRVEIFKFDSVEHYWVKLDNLGDYVLFLSAASSFSILEKDSRMSNRIYVPKRMKNRVVYYSLCTGKYHISSKEASLDDFYGMTGQSFCCWV